MGDRYTIEELEQAFHAYWHAKKRFLAVAKSFSDMHDPKDAEYVPLKKVSDSEQFTESDE